MVDTKIIANFVSQYGIISPLYFYYIYNNHKKYT